MAEYLIDENLPRDLTIWSSEKFVHVIDIPGGITDSHIWKYPINHNLIILTKDTDFYHRYVSGINSPKVVWFKIGNMKKPEIEGFISLVWSEAEQLLITKYFLIVSKEYIEAI